MKATSSSLVLPHGGGRRLLRPSFGVDEAGSTATSGVNVDWGAGTIKDSAMGDRSRRPRGSVTETGRGRHVQERTESAAGPDRTP